MDHLLVIDSMAAQELFISSQEGSGVDLRSCQISATQPPGLRMRANSARVSTWGNQWKACPAMTKSTLCVTEAGALRGALAHFELRIVCQVALAGFPHLAIRLDAD